jgi:hypothetical protein
MLMPTLTEFAELVEALATAFAGGLRALGSFLRRGTLEDLGEGVAQLSGPKPFLCCRRDGWRRVGVRKSAIRSSDIRR